jgi:hypothetical protein
MKQNYPIIFILSLSLLIGILTLTHYGESWDDLSLQKYAEKSLEAYRTWPVHGMDPISREDLGNYGPSYIMVVALGSKLLGNFLPISLSDIRHLLYFITYLAGVWAFYALGKRWLTEPASIAATLLFLTQPLLWGHAFMNPKDTPFLAFFLLSIFFGFKMTDSIKPLSFDTLTASTKWSLALLTALWLASVFSLFFLTEVIHGVIANLVSAARAGEENIISLIASDIHTVDPEIYIQKYFTLFIQIRSVFFLLFTGALAYFYLRNFPAAFHLLASAALPALLLGFTASVRVLGPFAGLLVLYYALRTQGRRAVPVLLVYAAVSMIAMYLTWPYLWTNPAGHFIESLKEMSLYPWNGLVLFKGVEYASTKLPYLYLPILLGIQLTEPVWALFLAGLVLAASVRRAKRVEGSGEKRELIELMMLWFVIPLIGFIILRSALYDNFRQILFILPPVFWMAGAAFEKIKEPKWQIALVTLCLIPGVIGIIHLYPYEYIYYNQFIGGVRGAQGRFELDYWGTSYREAADYINEIAPVDALVWVEGPSHLFELYARPDLKVFSDHENERADHYDYVVSTTRYGLDKTSYPNAKIIYKITRQKSVLSVIKQP